jgi:AcrR family transcriptional regulator
MDERRRRVMDPTGKREAALGAAERIFSREGYGNTSMAAIAKDADIAVGSLYRLFPDKAALLAALHIRMEDHFIASMLEAWGDGAEPRAAYRRLAIALMTTAKDALPIMPLYTLTRDVVGTTDYVPGRATVAAIAKVYANGVASGGLRPHDPNFAAAAAYGMVDGIMRTWMADPTDAHWTIAVETLATTLADSFVV